MTSDSLAAEAIPFLLAVVLFAGGVWVCVRFVVWRHDLHAEYDGGPPITVELAENGPDIVGEAVLSAIRVTNNGPELNRVFAQIEGHLLDMPDPFPLRTEGQIRGQRSGRFTLSRGQTKLVPIIYRVRARPDQIRFIDEDGAKYDLNGNELELIVGIYGPDAPTRARITLRPGEGIRPEIEMESLQYPKAN